MKALEVSLRLFYKMEKVIPSEWPFWNLKTPVYVSLHLQMQEKEVFELHKLKA